MAEVDARAAGWCNVTVRVVEDEEARRRVEVSAGGGHSSGTRPDSSSSISSTIGSITMLVRTPTCPDVVGVGVREGG